MRSLGILLVCILVSAIAHDALAFSAFKGRFASRGDDCVYPDRGGRDAVLKEGETMWADFENPHLSAFNDTCSCPGDNQTRKLERPAQLACTGGTLVTQRAAKCGCESTTDGGGMAKAMAAPEFFSDILICGNPRGRDMWSFMISLVNFDSAVMEHDYVVCYGKTYGKGQSICFFRDGRFSHSHGRGGTDMTYGCQKHFKSISDWRKPR